MIFITYFELWVYNSTMKHAANGGIISKSISKGAANDITDVSC